MRTRIACAAGALTAPLWAAAHEGHGLAGASHWHAGDALLFALALAVAGALWWRGRR